MNLQLSLKREWFYMTGPNGKTEDYREITPYWIKRLTKIEKANDYYLDYAVEYLKRGAEYVNGQKLVTTHLPNFCFPKKFNQNTITLGYPSKTDRSRFKIYEHAGIEIGFGKPEWGAPTDRMVFIIKHGKEIV